MSVTPKNVQGGVENLGGDPPHPLSVHFFLNPPLIPILINMCISMYFISLLDPLTHFNFWAYMGVSHFN